MSRSIYQKLLIDGDWNIAIRKKSDKPFFDYSDLFFPISKNKKYWFADPMLFEFQGKTFLFCEAFDRKTQKGELGYFTIDEDSISDYKSVVVENYHLSYPCVFSHKSDVYMIPESGENKSVDLYKAVNFPDVWEKKCTLINGINLADPTVFFHNDSPYMIGYQNSNELIVYKISNDLLSADMISTIKYETNTGRPAGYVINCDDNLVRPSQDCRYEYGKNIIFRSIAISNEKYIESDAFELDLSRVKIKDEKHVDRVHTYNQSDKYEVIDYLCYSINVGKMINKLNRHLKYKARTKRRL